MNGKREQRRLRARAPHGRHGKRQILNMATAVAVRVNNPWTCGDLALAVADESADDAVSAAVAEHCWSAVFWAGPALTPRRSRTSRRRCAYQRRTPRNHASCARPPDNRRPSICAWPRPARRQPACSHRRSHTHRRPRSRARRAACARLTAMQRWLPRTPRARRPQRNDRIGPLPEGWAEPYDATVST